MAQKKKIAIFWFRRDLRLHDNAGLYHALKDHQQVLLLFIFDTEILDKLQDKDDSRITFIYHALEDMQAELHKQDASLCVKIGKPAACFRELLDEYEIESVYTNHDYEPYAKERDEAIGTLLAKQGVKFCTFKDHVIFEKNEVVKDDGTPYTVFTPYQRRWLQKLTSFYLKSYPTEKYFGNFVKLNIAFPALADTGFEASKLDFPDKEYKHIIADYRKTRDFPAIEGTSRISVHLRFGTLSIRELARDADHAREKTWLAELIWRDFYAMILWHFPHSATYSFKKQYDNIRWRDSEQDFKAWCEGKTGYPIVDAGMRQLNESGWMHNRIRMVTASFLCKHLLIDWRLGEAYFARYLIDYDMSSNIGGWQWAASSGNDAVPYFRIFNPDLQTKKFDPKLDYIRKWVPEFQDFSRYPAPIVEHKAARERALTAFKKALEK